MRTEITAIYEQQDFEDIKQKMTKERAIEIIEGLPRGYFPYNMPMWSASCGSWDLDNYEICVALDMAVKALKKKDSK